MPGRITCGLSRREMESEVKWALRRVPQGTGQLSKMITDLMVKLIDKNNMAIEASLQRIEDDSTF
jgi:hypothetical protein